MKSRNFLDRIVLFVATGCGIGLIAPFAPGTFGSAAGVALAYATTRLPVLAQIPVCLALAVAAIPFCGAAEKRLGIKDDGRITADEWMLYPLALIGIPVCHLPWHAMAAFFLVIRAVDIVKPPPARQVQALHGGFGIVIDDFIANLYSLGLNWAIYVLCYS